MAMVEDFFDSVRDAADSIQLENLVIRMMFNAGSKFVINRISGRSSSPSIGGQADEFEKIIDKQQQKQRQLDAHWEWTDLRKSIEQELQEYDQVTVKLPTTQGMEEISFNAHFWSRDRLRSTARTLLDVELSTDTPMEVILQYVDEARDVLQRLQEICQEAGESFVDSQQRLQLCLAIWKAFLQRGWRQERDEDCDFKDQDEREALNLCLYSPANDEMRLSFNPDHTIGLKMRFNGVYNRDLQKEIARELVSVLDQQGVAVDSIDCVN